MANLEQRRYNKAEDERIFCLVETLMGMISRCEILNNGVIIIKYVYDVEDGNVSGRRI